MGMHFGIVASRVPLGRLLEELNEAGIALRLVRELAGLDDVPGGNEADYVVGGERGGATFLIDQSMLISAGRADELAAIAKRTGEMVVGCGAETVSGTYWLTAFSGARLLRVFWMCHSELTTPFSDGTPLRSEAARRIDGDIDGGGIVAALHELGFDYEDWIGVGPFRLFAVERLADPKEQPLEEAMKEHWATHQIPPGERPGLTVVSRRAPGSTPWDGLVRWVRRFF